MKDDDLKDFANQFIQTWQENFAKLGEDNQIMELFAANMHNMQQFYDKSTAATFNDAFKFSSDSVKWRDFERRLTAIENKLDNLGKVKTTNKKRSAK